MAERAPLGELSLNTSANEHRAVIKLNSERPTAIDKPGTFRSHEEPESSAESSASSQPSEVEKQHLLRASRAAQRRLHSSEAARARLQVDWGHTQV